MTITELIAALEAVKAEHGDLECMALRRDYDQPSGHYPIMYAVRERYWHPGSPHLITPAAKVVLRLFA